MMRRRRFVAAVAAWAAAGRTPADGESDGSMIRSIAYDARTQTLTVVMAKDGRTYRYLRVPDKVYRDFAAAKSKGTFYLLYIKGRYEFRVE